jgi:hypothetical protein
MSIKDMVNDIASGNLANAGKAFESEMMEKIQDAINIERVRVSTNLLQPADEVVEESVEIDEEVEQLDESDALAKKVAQHAASAHKSLKVTSHGSDHYVHRKDDPDGEDGYIHVKHDNGKFHVSSESGVAGGESKSFGNHEDAAKHAHKIASA